MSKPAEQKRNVWNIVLKVVAAAVTALLGALGIQSCISL
ncbi:smalltalk protein [Phocaeicola coprophilus]|nr:smalltalk protein [Phocaeicola coprophilus]